MEAPFDIILRYIDVEKTEKIKILEPDLAILVNPWFLFDHHAPYLAPCTIGILCVEGNLIGQVDFKDYHLSAGDFLVAVSGHAISTTFVNPDFKCYCILMGDTFASDVDIAGAFHLKQKFSEAPYIKLDYHSHTICQLFCQSCLALLDIPNAMETRKAIQTITKGFLMGLNSQFLFPSRDPSAASNRSIDITMQFFDLVKKNHAEHHDVAYYAGLLCITPKYLTTAVRQATGKSAMTWIERYIMHHAQTLLTSGAYSIKQVGDLLGFGSQSEFGRYFHRFTGVSPKAWIKSSR